MDVPPPGAALAAAELNLRQEGSGFEKFKRSRTALTVVAGLASEVMRPGTAGNRFSYVKGQKLHLRFAVVAGILRTMSTP